MKYENCVEKQTIEYTHTTVPASMRSPYWKYFGFPSDSANKILTRQKIICTLCGTAITYNKNTSNLRTHLISRHPERLHEMHHQQRQQCSAFSRSSNMDGGDSDDASTDILNEIEADEESEVKAQSCKRSNSEDLNVDNLLKVKRLSAGCRESNKITLSISQENCRNQHQGTVAVPNSLHKKEFQDDQQSGHNEEHETIVTNGCGYELLSSETVNALATNGVEDVTVSCANNFVVETLHNEADEFAEGEPVILDNDLTQKSMFDYSNDSPSNLHEQANISNTMLGEKDSYIELLANMLVTDMLPPNLLQGQGFKQLLNSIGITNVDKCEVEKIILADYGQMQYILKKYVTTNLLQQDKPYSLSIENYMDIEEQIVFSIYINFLNFDFDNKLESVLYEEIVCRNQIDLHDVLRDFDLNRCAAIVTTMKDNSIIKNFATSHGIEVVPCLEALLTRCLNLIFEQDEVSQMFNNIFKLRQNLNLPEPHLNCPWWKLKFLQDFLDIPNETGKQYSELSSELESFMAYLNPLKITLDTINTEPLPLCTLVRPLIMKLFEEHFLVFNTDDNIYLQSAQQVINDELRQSIAKCSFFSEAVLFDVRFQHDFIQPRRHPTHQSQKAATFDNIQRVELAEAVCQRFQRLMTVPPSNIKLDQSQQCAITQVAPKSSLRSFFHRISGAASRKNAHNLSPEPSQPKDAIELEFNRYKCEPTLDLEQCPISWWQMQSQQYKQLYKFANYYLSVPCYAFRWPTSAYDETETNERSVWCQKRRSLRHQHPVEKCLWYLHYNRAFHSKIKPK
ncbi:uncharacterized protein LOC129243104 [Anastrepha obliqua]|uniref:uncharacterized protein LOC129243104 n=1 Tax=Anastrepha obliqua TaxID=95512 RepID=UPI00240A3E9A|nr:uncharacterized protein LOC129243104 [Anastrepha obliqua]